MIVPEKPPLDEYVLQHYGVKGMRWGEHKRDQPAYIQRGRSKTTFTKEQRKAANKNFAQYRKDTLVKKFENDPSLFRRAPITEAQYKQLGTRDEIIRKGSTLYRATPKPNDLSKSGVLFVSTNRADANVYKTVLTNEGIRGLGSRSYKENYEIQLKALDTLRSPSEKARVDAFVSLMDTPSIVLKNGKTVTGRELLKKNENFKKDAKRLDTQRLGLETYKSFAETQWMSDPINTAYFKALRDKGYNAVIDDNDRGHLTKQPLIVLNPDGSVKRMGVHRITADEINTIKTTIKAPTTS